MKNNKISGLLIGIIFTGFGGTMFYKGSYDTLIYSFESENWPTVEAKVVTSYVNNKAGEDKNLYNLVFSAEYSVGNKDYSSNGPYLKNGGSSSFAGNRYDFINRYPEGTKIRIFYNPEKPYISTMEPGFKSVYAEMIFFSGLFFLVGILFVVSFITRYFSQNKQNISKDKRRKENPNNDFDLDY